MIKRLLNGDRENIKQFLVGLIPLISMTVVLVLLMISNHNVPEPKQVVPIVTSDQELTEEIEHVPDGDPVSE